MDILMLNLSLEKLQVNQSTKGYQPAVTSSFLHLPEMRGWMTTQDNALEEMSGKVSGANDSSVRGLHSFFCRDETVMSLERADILRCSYSSGPTGASQHPAASYDCDAVPHDDDDDDDEDGDDDGGDDTQTQITSFSISQPEETDSSLYCGIRFETSVAEDASLSSLSAAIGDHLSSEEELLAIDWSNCLVDELKMGSSDDEVCKITNDLRRSSSDCFCPVAMASELQPETLPISKKNGMPLKRKALLISGSSDSSAVILRPNLDFDKMRKTSYGRSHSRTDIKKPKIVRIRGFRDPTKCIRSLQNKFSTSVSAFCSLSQRVGFSRVASTQSLSS